MRREKLAIVIPLANEEDTVEELLQRILRVVEAHDRVYCVVDRVSKDNTLELVRGCAGRDARVVPVWAPENRSVVDAYFRGYREALAGESDWILEMDGGLSHSPEQIPRFVDAMVSGVDFAAGSRFVEGGSHDGNLKRHLISKGGTMITNVLLGTRMRDMMSGFQCFTRPALTHVVEQGVNSRAHFFQTEIRAMLHDWNWIEIPINYASPKHGVGTSSIADAFSNLWRLFRARRSSVGKSNLMEAQR